MKSWKTTAAGMLGAVSILLAQASYFLDGKPETVVDLTAITTAAGLIWLGISARDNNVSSERAGVK